MPLVEKRYLFTFILITALFALWGFANDITNPLVAAFQTLMEISAAKASMVQFAFYGGYDIMAIPAALFIHRFSYKVGVLIVIAVTKMPSLKSENEQGSEQRRHFAGRCVLGDGYCWRSIVL